MTVPPPLPLSSTEKRILLAVARAAIEASMGGVPAAGPARRHARLEMPQGAFVTLALEGALRGCVGVVEPVDALWDTVAHCAAAAALEDRRFAPITARELIALRIEITLLHPSFRPRGADAIVPGRHGLIVTGGSRRGVLLPRVALERGWSAPRFILETLRKAGLPEDALERRAATLLAFEADIFSEEDEPDL